MLQGWLWLTLQYLEILQVRVLGVGVELDSRHGYIIWPQCQYLPCQGKRPFLQKMLSKT